MTDQETAKTPNPARVLAKTLWQMDNSETFETSEARKEAYRAVKSEYIRKAKRVTKSLGKKGVTLLSSGVPSQDT